MKRKRIQYNELSEEIYSPKYWTKTRLIVSGLVILIFGFLFNFSLEEKINKYLLMTLSSNQACPILFEKAELSYFLPKIDIQKPVILGSCFGQVNNKLPLHEFKIALSGPSFYPPGIKLHVTVTEGKTKLSLYPTLSPFSQYVEIDDSKIDSTILAAMMADNKSPVAGILTAKGSLKFSSGGTLEDGHLNITSRDFRFPAQNLSGFEMPLITLNRLFLKAHFTNKTTMQIDQIQLGQSNSPMEINLKGNLLVNQQSFVNSQLQLNGTLHLTNFMMTNFPIIKFYLPQDNQSGTYQMKIMGPLGNPGKPQFK